MIAAAHQTMMGPQETWPVPLHTGVSLVGSSVQNNNGILSGFTSSSYAKMPYYWTSGASQIEAVCKFTLNSGTQVAGIWGCVGSTNAFTPVYKNTNGPIGAYLSSTGSGAWQADPEGTASALFAARYQANNTSTGAGTYVVRFCYHDQTVEMFKHDNGVWTRYTNHALSSIHGAANLVQQLGTNRGTSNPLNGTIDLNYTYLYRDGELWWEGAPGAYKNVKTTYPD